MFLALLAFKSHCIVSDEYGVSDDEKSGHSSRQVALSKEKLQE